MTSREVRLFMNNDSFENETSLALSVLQKLKEHLADCSDNYINISNESIQKLNSLKSKIVQNKFYESHARGRSEKKEKNEKNEKNIIYNYLFLFFVFQY